MSRKPIEILEIGTQVSLGGVDGEPVVATVTCVQFGGGSAVSYRVAWWNGRCRQEDWVTPSELNLPPPTPTTKIGFVSHITEQG